MQSISRGYLSVSLDENCMRLKHFFFSLIKKSSHNIIIVVVHLAYMYILEHNRSYFYDPYSLQLCAVCIIEACSIKVSHGVL